MSLTRYAVSRRADRQNIVIGYVAARSVTQARFAAAQEYGGSSEDYNVGLARRPLETTPVGEGAWKAEAERRARWESDWEAEAERQSRYNRAEEIVRGERGDPTEPCTYGHYDCAYVERGSCTAELVAVEYAKLLTRDD